jgi:hypothetical protein
MRRSCKTPSCRFRDERQAQAALACVIVAFDLAPRATINLFGDRISKVAAVPQRRPMALRLLYSSWMTAQPLGDAGGFRKRLGTVALKRSQQKRSACAPCGEKSGRVFILRCR